MSCVVPIVGHPNTYSADCAGASGHSWCGITAVTHPSSRSIASSRAVMKRRFSAQGARGPSHDPSSVYRYPQSHASPLAKGPSQEVIAAVVDMKQRNPSWG